MEPRGSARSAFWFRRFRIHRITAMGHSESELSRIHFNPSHLNKRAIRCVLAFLSSNGSSMYVSAPSCSSLQDVTLRLLDERGVARPKTALSERGPLAKVG